MSALGGCIASKTPVNLGEYVTKAMRSYLAEYQPMEVEGTPESVLFAFWRQVRHERYAFVIIQGARNYGKVTAEIAVNVRNKIPYYKMSDKPELGKFGVRDRVCWIMAGVDSSHVYSSIDMLEKVLHEIITVYVHQSMRRIFEVTDVEFEKNMSTWMPLYEEWQLADQASTSLDRLKYLDLENEDLVRSYLEKNVIYGNYFHRFLGGLRSQFKDVGFFNCFVYLMGRALEFLNPPKEDAVYAAPALEEETKQEAANPSKARIYWSDIFGPSNAQLSQAPTPLKIRDRAEPLEDVTLSLTGRVPQSLCVKLSSDPEERRLEYAFYTVMAVMEGIYRPYSAGGLFS